MKVLFFIILVVCNKSVVAQGNSVQNKDKGYEYNVINNSAKHSHQKIHVVKIDLSRYEIGLASAHDSVFGREKVGDIVLKEKADIGINAGFFQIGNNEDGRPTGTLIIKGKLFGLKNGKHDVFVIRNGKPSIEIWEPKIVLQIGQAKIIPHRYNKFADKEAVVLYSDKWGNSTLTNYNNREEVIISENGIVTEIKDHGNNLIPRNGYILSLPKNYDTSLIKIGDHSEFVDDQFNIFDSKISAVMGIPFLVLDGKINEKLSDSEKHARTAIGIDQDGKVILVVVECMYQKALKSLTLQETQEIFRKKNISLDDMKVSTVKKILMAELAKNSDVKGMTMKELANFMIEQGCKSAINLDGGGSSTLYIEGQYINHSVGDKDEDQGVETVRSVSDVVIFKKNSVL